MPLSTKWLWMICVASGVLLARYDPLFAEDQKSDGIHDTYYKTGEVKYESRYKDGQLEGLTTEYRKDGTVKDRFQFKGGDVVSKQSNAPARDMGALAFLFTWWFWLAILVPGVGLWFLFTRVMMRNKM